MDWVFFEIILIINVYVFISQLSHAATCNISQRQTFLSCNNVWQWLERGYWSAHYSMLIYHNVNTITYVTP